MTYVDIGWPCGLVIISINCFLYGDGYHIRKYISCGLLFLHGIRMFIGALLLFGKMSNFTYQFKEDLPRYQFAKYRWIEIDGMSTSTWWLKVQHDCGQQGFANCSLLVLPTMLCSFNKDQHINIIEICGWFIWIVSYIFENFADYQKQLFLSDIRKDKKSGKFSELYNDPSFKPCLGMKPYNTKKYFLWTYSRHPNYFGEFCCWCGFAIAASSSIPYIILNSTSTESFKLSIIILKFLNHNSQLIIYLLYLSLFLMVRVFYDCLVWWTGAAPAEHYSSIKRKEYCEYQSKVRCLFPFPFPFIGDHRISGWPNENIQKKQK